MAYKITDNCNNCRACEPECPNSAITQGPDIFVIDPALCTECVGFHDTPQCAAVCAVDACITDPEQTESESVLLERVKKLHPKRSFSEKSPSHFKKK